MQTICTLLQCLFALAIIVCLQCFDAVGSAAGRASSLSGTNQVSWYQNGKTNLDFTQARDSEWQWHQLGHMQVCTLLQTDNHTNTSSLNFYRPDALPAAQPTVSKQQQQQQRPFNGL